MESRVIAVRVTADGTAFAYPARVVNLTGVATGASTVTLKDGGSSGEVRLIADVTTGFFDLNIPRAGLAFVTSCYVDLGASITGVTLYGA